MGRKPMEKVYRKLVDEEDEFKRFQLIERLHPQESKELLFKVSFNLLPTLHKKSSQTSTHSRYYEVVASCEEGYVIDRAVGSYMNVLSFIYHYQQSAKVHVMCNGSHLSLRMENGEITESGDQQLFMDVITILGRTNAKHLKGEKVS